MSIFFTHTHTPAYWFWNHLRIKHAGKIQLSVNWLIYYFAHFTCVTFWTNNKTMFISLISAHFVNMKKNKTNCMLHRLSENERVGAVVMLYDGTSYKHSSASGSQQADILGKLTAYLQKKTHCLSYLKALSVIVLLIWIGIKPFSTEWSLLIYAGLGIVMAE